MKALLSSALVGGVAMLGLGLAGCQSLSQDVGRAATVVGFTTSRSAAIHTAAIASGPATLAAKAVTSDDIRYSVCAQVSDWERPTEDNHVQQLEAIPRYGKAIYQDPLRSLLEDFRNFSVVSFTTYGLSARSEPLYLTGVWTALEDIEPCYSQGQPARIGNGELGEAWLMGYAVSDLTWADGAYRLTVEPGEGLQVLQFERREELATLPLQVVATNGGAISVQSGDYSAGW